MEKLHRRGLHLRYEHRSLNIITLHDIVCSILTQCRCISAKNQLGSSCERTTKGMRHENGMSCFYITYFK